MKQVKELFESELFKKQMTRKDFIQFAGLAILAIFGLKNFVTFLTEQTRSQSKGSSTGVSDQTNTHGFGSSKFGV